MSENPKKVVFLDRDGTINIDNEYVFKIEKDETGKNHWEWCEGAIEGLKLLQDAGYVLAIVTNQSGIARDYYTVEDMNKLHEFMNAELAKHGVSIAHIAYCPHNRPKDGEQPCRCRKPDIGMAEEIEAAIGLINYEESWVIGDKGADIGLGKNIKAHTVRIRSEYDPDDAGSPEHVVDSLLEAARIITA